MRKNTYQLTAQSNANNATPVQETLTDEAVSFCPAPAVPAKSTAGSQGILFVDTETTGLGYLEEVVEIAIVDVNENILFESLVKPRVPITSGARAVHGITNEMVAKAPNFSDILPTIQGIVKGYDLVFYNAAFDKGKIARTAFTSIYPKSKNLSANFDDYFYNPTHCLMREYAEFWGDWDDYFNSHTWQTLVNACYQQAISIDDIPNHRASGDAIKTARLWRKRQEVGWTYPVYEDDGFPF